MPYRNAAATLGPAIESILAQRDVDLELIAIDDGSTDAGAAQVAALRKRDRRIVSHRTGGRGIVAALSRGLAVASGRFIARMDADDVSSPDRLALQVAALRDRSTLGAVGTQVAILSATPVAGGMSRYVAWQNSLLTPEDHRRDLFVESPLCHASVMLQREALEAAGGWCEVTWAEDYDLWLRLDARGWGLAKVPRVLHQWRLHPNQTTFRDPRYARERFYEAKAAYLAPKLKGLGRPLAVWGAGPTGRRLARALEKHGLEADRFIDIDPRKLGGAARRKRIEGPDALKPGAFTVLAAVGSFGARDEIRAYLDTRGFVEGTDFVCAA